MEVLRQQVGFVTVLESLPADEYNHAEVDLAQCVSSRTI